MREIVITSTILILILILIRKLCWGKISRRFQYALWLLAVIRLLVPTQLLVSPVSVMNVVEDAEEAVYSQWQDNQSEENNAPIGNILSEEGVQTGVSNAVHSEGMNMSDKYPEINSDITKINSEEILKAVLFGIYITGVCVTGCCIIWCNWRFYKKLAADRTYIGKEGRLKVYGTSQVLAPCLFGFPIPSVYVTENAFSSEERKTHILLHEMTHYRHLDHIWAVVRSLCISLYWFHPLVWLAAKLSIEDSELACDEGTFLRIGAENREAYGRTLIEMTLEQSKKSRLLYCATGMTSGKKEIKKRIKAIALYKKQMAAIAAAVLIAAVMLAACTAGAVEPKVQAPLEPSLVKNEEGSFSVGDGIFWGIDWETAQKSDVFYQVDVEVVRDDALSTAVGVKGLKFFDKTVEAGFQFGKDEYTNGLFGITIKYQEEDGAYILNKMTEKYGERQSYFLDEKGMENPINPAGWYTEERFYTELTEAEQEALVSLYKDKGQTFADAILRQPLVIIKVYEEAHMIELSGSNAAVVNNIERWQTAEDVIKNADGSFRLSEYTVDLTGDKINERIVFDVMYSEEAISESEAITEQMLWDKLWNGNAEITVKVLEGQEEGSDTEEQRAEEIVLAKYNYAREHAGNGNLAVGRYKDRWCLMTYKNTLLNDKGTFGYEIWQINASGEEPELVEEMSVSYREPVNEGNSQETIDSAIQIGERLDEYLSGHNTDILVNASVSDIENCYIHGSETGLLNGARRQKAFDVFMAEAGGTGLELKISDYFYPNGMESITVLPEDAEERILRGEILYMEVSPENNTAGRLDLDGDGEKEVLYLEAMSGFYSDDGWDTSYGKNRIDRNGYRVRVNEQYYVESYCSTVDPILMAYSPNGKDILLAVYDAGPSGDPETFFYKYDDTGVQPAGVLPNDLRDAEIEADGTIKCTFRGDMIQTEFAWGYFVWNGSEIVRRADDVFYFVDDSEWRETSELPLMLLKEITVYEERSEDSLAITMKPQKVRNVASDQKEWIFLEAEDGTKGWIRVEYYGYFPSEEADNFDLFDGLSMAG